MKVWIEKLQQLQWQKLDRLSVVVFAFWFYGCVGN